MTTIHGNYQGYSGASRHAGTNSASHVIDSRLLHLPPTIFANASILDIGCNNGAIAGHLCPFPFPTPDSQTHLQAKLTSEPTVTFFSPRKVVGVDIDETLIDKARSHISFILSRRHPAATVDAPHYFPISSVLQHGHLPPFLCAPRPGAAIATFETEDWPATPLAPSEAGSYDVVLALSVVKWVHLHRGDAGLLAAFAKIAAALKPRGRLVLEPQPWPSYASAARKNPALKPALARLRLAPDEGFARPLAQAGFSLERVWGQEVGLKRVVFLYRKKE